MDFGGLKLACNDSYKRGNMNLKESNRGRIYARFREQLS